MGRVKEKPQESGRKSSVSNSYFHYVDFYCLEGAYTWILPAVAPNDPLAFFSPDFPSSWMRPFLWCPTAFRWRPTLKSKSRSFSSLGRQQSSPLFYLKKVSRLCPGGFAVDSHCGLGKVMVQGAERLFLFSVAAPVLMRLSVGEEGSGSEGRQCSQVSERHHYLHACCREVSQLLI